MKKLFKVEAIYDLSGYLRYGIKNVIIEADDLKNAKQAMTSDEFDEYISDIEFNNVGYEIEDNSIESQTIIEIDEKEAKKITDKDSFYTF